MRGSRRPLLRFTLGALAVLVAMGGWVAWREIWGRPLWIAHFYERVFIELMLDNPQLLSQVGLVDNTWLDFNSGKLDDASPAATERTAAWVRRDLALLREYPLAEQTPSQRQSTLVLDWFLDDRARGAAFRYHDYPVNQLDGAQIDEPDFMVQIHSVVDRRSAERYLERLDGFARYFDQVIESVKLRESKGISPPRFVVTESLAQMRDFVGKPADRNILYTSFAEKLSKATGLSGADRDALLAQAKGAIENRVYPAYARLIAYEEALEPKARTTDGVWALPDGDAYYAWLLRHQTTTDLTPAQVHELGLSEVDRISKEAAPLLDALHLPPGTVAERLDALGRDPKYIYAANAQGREAMLAEFRRELEAMWARLPEWFDELPRDKPTVAPVPEFKAASAPGAYYQPPALDGSRPGTFFANVWDPLRTPRWAMPTLAYHEGVPGHHLQLSLQAQMKDVPTFRKVLPFTAYGEGWALYSERLAYEVGFENDPADDLGRLQAELFRAARLVVDTGIHYKRWSRQQAIDYMVATTGMPHSDIVAEIERYIVEPGQACAYKVGMAKILELRDLAKAELGARFDIRKFHRAVLQDGSAPLSVLDARVRAWIASEKR